MNEMSPTSAGPAVLSTPVSPPIASPGRPGGDLGGPLDSVRRRLASMNPSLPAYATDAVDALLEFANVVGTSDMHLQPVEKELDVRFRHDGVLQPVAAVAPGTSSSIAARLKVLADLLTYQNDVPQEGRIANPRHGREIRVSTFPTLHGERVVLRFFGHQRDFAGLDDLGNPPQLTARIRDALVETSGAMLISGPAGSGKSTTLYACLRHIVTSTNGSRSVVSIEDPIEVPVAGVAQSQVDQASGFDLKMGLRSLMR